MLILVLAIRYHDQFKSSGKGALGPVLSGTRVMLTDKRGSPPLWHSEFFKTFAGEGRMAAIASTLLGEVQRAGP